MVQWLSIHPAMQGTWVQALVRDLRSNMPQSNKALCTITSESMHRNERSLMIQRRSQLLQLRLNAAK